MTRSSRQQGDLWFKTDNQRFFEWTLAEICQFGWLLQNISLDLHHSDFEGNVMTEYEEKFSVRGRAHLPAGGQAAPAGIPAQVKTE